MQREIRAHLRLLSDSDRLAGDSYLGKTSFVWMWMDPFLMAKVFALSEQQRYSWFEKGEALKGWSVRLLTNPVEARRVSHSPIRWPIQPAGHLHRMWGFVSAQYFTLDFIFNFCFNFMLRFLTLTTIFVFVCNVHDSFCLFCPRLWRITAHSEIG